MKSVQNMKANLPLFFNYKEENTDNGYETIQDFFLSWVLRCSAEEYNIDDNLVHKISKKITCKLLKISDAKSVVVKSVKTSRQWRHIDLLAEIITMEGAEEKKYALNIENKWYTSIRDNQLEKNLYYFSNKYKNDKWNKLNYLIFCDYEKIDNITKDKAKKNNYIILTICDLQEEIGELESTGNSLFDAFWYWNYPVNTEN